MLLTGETEWSIGAMLLTGETEWSIGAMLLTGETEWSIGAMLLTGETVEHWCNAKTHKYSPYRAVNTFSQLYKPST
jgi:hypothetical protein